MSDDGYDERGELRAAYSIEVGDHVEYQTSEMDERWAGVITSRTDYDMEVLPDPPPLAADSVSIDMSAIMSVTKKGG